MCVCGWGCFLIQLLLSLDHYYSDNIKTKWPDQINLTFKICYDSHRISVKSVYSMTYIHHPFKKKINYISQTTDILSEHEATQHKPLTHLSSWIFYKT